MMFQWRKFILISVALAIFWLIGTTGISYWYAILWIVLYGMLGLRFVLPGTSLIIEKSFSKDPKYGDLKADALLPGWYWREPLLWKSLGSIETQTLTVSHTTTTKNGR